MPLPSLLLLASPAEYCAHWEASYVRGAPLLTHDGVRVRVYSNQFRHAFYTKSSPAASDKDSFDWSRAERMGWIRAVLEDASLMSYRRVVPQGLTRIFLEETTPYVVVIRPLPSDASQAIFITAYVVDRPGVVAKIKSNPLW